MATRVLGSYVGISIIRFLGSRTDHSAYWREISKGLAEHAPITVRRQLESLEDTGVVTVSTPFGDETPPRGSRTGTPVLYTLDVDRLDSLFALTRAWLAGGDPPPISL